MKKILMICMMGMLAVMPAHATTMCAADDTLTIVLDPMVNSIGGGNNPELFEWRTEFPYGTIFGIATCVSTPRGAPTDILIDADSGEIATGGERLGGHCWCKMTHPLKSRWMYRFDCGSLASCRVYCSSYCNTHLHTNVRERQTLFMAVFDE